MIRFKISDNEQQFKYQFFARKKCNQHISIFDWSYYLVHDLDNIEQYYLMVSLERNKSSMYNNKIYKISNAFGQFCLKDIGQSFPERYLLPICNNYYLVYYYSTSFVYFANNAINNILCYVIYLNDNELQYDEDYFDFATLTARKIYGMVNGNISIKEIDTKLAMFKSCVNAKALLANLVDKSFI